MENRKSSGHEVPSRPSDSLFRWFQQEWTILKGPPTPVDLRLTIYGLTAASAALTAATVTAVASIAATLTALTALTALAALAAESATTIAAVTAVAASATATTTLASATTLTALTALTTEAALSTKATLPALTTKAGPARTHLRPFELKGLAEHLFPGRLLARSEHSHDLLVQLGISFLHFLEVRRSARATGSALAESILATLRRSTLEAPLATLPALLGRSTLETALATLRRSTLTAATLGAALRTVSFHDLANLIVLIFGQL